MSTTDEPRPVEGIVVRQEPPEAVEGEWEDCWSCGGEGGYHDCGEDTCCCLDPDEPNMPCRECGGKGGWIVPYNAPLTGAPTNDKQSHDA